MEMVFTCWIIFEDSIDLIYSHIVEKDELDKNFNMYFFKILEFLTPIEDNIKTKIQEKLKTPYININSKYNYLLNIINKNKLKIKTYRKFLEFFNVTRNCLHFNSRPIKDYSFSLPFGNFELKKGEIIEYFTYDVIEHSIKYFIEIFNFIRVNLPIDSVIINPATKIEY
jgi:hypothetical protein